MPATLPDNDRPRCNQSTRELARRFSVTPGAPRRSLCIKGHFLGLVPLKLPNGRLLWPDVWPEDLAGGR